MAAFTVEFLRAIALPIRIAALIAYLVIACFAYYVVKRRGEKSHHLQESKWRRYHLLDSRMLAIVGGFLKERYQVNHWLATEIDRSLEEGTLTAEVFQRVVEEADKERRSQVKSALSELSSFLREDPYKAPLDPDGIAQEHFKVSFYEVETDKQTGNSLLVKKWRYYPNEGEPRTPSFRKGEGASGIAWDTKKIVVCAEGGADPVFKDMWEGGGQKERYASMICVPAIEDIPSERISEVYGVLRVDTPRRVGYFDKNLEQLWADLFQPVCNLLIYSHESERMKSAVRRAVMELTEKRGPSPLPKSA